MWWCERLLLGCHLPLPRSWQRCMQGACTICNATMVAVPYCSEQLLHKVALIIEVRLKKLSCPARCCPTLLLKPVCTKQQ